ncbi:TetR/AcrR family transcriptional regulator [Nesterenkonia muleiensis]|uniref:TetR/AcrR family transcriptional regulator n=1 Tax=Nesterenkonia muleiensis TaxID=2282648 RepID=UPI00192E4C16|nr:TetR/AcrR family transcriptional regulator [Nesterenkonia muleiensis]
MAQKQGNNDNRRSSRPNRGPLAAAENRRALIAAARREFADHGAAAPLSRIAQRAGVGQGSLYRHFSDRVDLATAVFEENLQQLSCDVADSDRPYTVFMQALEHQAAEASALVEIVSAEQARERGAPLRHQLRSLVAQVHRAGQQVGELSPEVSAGELVTASSMFALTVAKAPASERADAAARARRILDAWFLSSV